MDDSKAIQILEELPDAILVLNHPEDIDWDFKEALNKAVQALKDRNGVAGYTYEQLDIETVHRPVDKWVNSPGTNVLTCPVCRELHTRGIFNNFCPNCGAHLFESAL